MHVVWFSCEMDFSPLVSEYHPRRKRLGRDSHEWRVGETPSLLENMWNAFSPMLIFHMSKVNVTGTVHCFLKVQSLRGLRGIVFTRSVCLCVCVCVCVCVCLCVCPANIWYFISQLLEEISIWNVYRILIGLYSIHWKKIDLHRSKVKVTRTVHYFLKVQSYHKNWAIEKFQFLFIDTS